jgi:hypothetical protein
MSNRIQILSIKLSSAQVASRNITKMLFFMLLIYYIGYLPFLFDLVLIYSDFPRNTFYLAFTYFAIFSKGLSKSITIIIYYNFNKEYKRQFKSYLNRCLNR